MAVWTNAFFVTGIVALTNNFTTALLSATIIGGVTVVSHGESRFWGAFSRKSSAKRHYDKRDGVFRRIGDER